MIELIMIVVFILAAILGAIWAKKNIHADVSQLYSTRPLSSQQIDVLNAELKELAAQKA